MPNYPAPADAWLAAQIRQLKQDVAALKAQRTEFVVNAAGVCEAIIGNLTVDPNGNPTGLSGFGIAVWSGSAWVALPAGVMLANTSLGQKSAFAMHSTTGAVLGSGGSAAKVSLPTIDYDKAGWCSSGRFTPQIAGVYTISAGVLVLNSLAADQWVNVSVFKNGAAVSGNAGTASYPVPGGGGIGGFIYPSVTTDVSLNGTTDYVELWGVCRLANNTQDGTSTFTGWMNGHCA